ncbi:hypothetical protein BD310DRAFT_942248 [Dichomitus squalens]|uniref:Uncharacterized protein n=1 Tax=Dichomitus squalens TaxID=114155 RepID=A0A4Q9P9T9_9APHY|nr:hypothetical protein BD310DRAFT_942248 [Dichomitus squalens]
MAGLRIRGGEEGLWRWLDTEAALQVPSMFAFHVSSRYVRYGLLASSTAGLTLIAQSKALKH